MRCLSGRLNCIVLCLLAGLPMLARAQGYAGAAVRVEVERQPAVLQARSVSMLELPADGVRARWWLRHGSIEVGGGADLAAPPLGVHTTFVRRTATPTLGVRAQLAPGAYLALERDAVKYLPRDQQGSVNDTARLALELKPAEFKRANALSSGMLRVQLTSASALQFRPRGGGLTVTYSERF